MAKQKVWEADISTAADLVKALGAIGEQFDLSVMYVKRPPESKFAAPEYESAVVYEDTLTDGSVVHDLVLL